MRLDLRPELLAHLRREVRLQVQVEVRVVGELPGQQLLGQHDLGPRQQHRQLGRGEPAAAVEPPAYLAPGRQPLDLAVEGAGLLEAAHEVLVHVQQRRRVGDGVRDGEVLLVVVAQHERGNLVGHLREQGVALLGGEVAVLDHPVEQDLDVDLVVGRVDAGRVVDEVGVDPAALLAGAAGVATAQDVLDAAGLGETEVAALPHAPGADLGAVDPDRVVGLVADVGVGLALALDVGADAAVPQQVDRRLEDRLHQLGRGHGLHRLVDAQDLADRVVERDRLERAREDTATLGDQALVVVLPARARQVEEPPALGVRRGGVRRRVEEDVAVVERRDQPGGLGAQQPVAEHVAAHVADADRRELLGLAVDPALAEVPLHRDPGAAGGDAHRLVVVAHRATAGERVAQPEAVVLRDAVRDVRERRRALVGRDHQVGVVAVVANHALGRHGLAVDPVVGDVEQPGDERLVAGHALGQPGVPVAGVGQLLAEEPALRADRHDHGVLDHLRLDQAEHLGAEVVAPVRPAQAAARHGAEPQVHALDPR